MKKLDQILSYNCPQELKKILCGGSCGDNPIDDLRDFTVQTCCFYSFPLNEHSEPEKWSLQSY